MRDINIIHTLYRSTFPSRWELTARSVRNTSFTRSPSTRRVRILLSDKEREDMIWSRKVSEVRPSPSSERRPRPPRRSLSSLNALPARPVDSTPSSVASHSFSERRISQRVAQSSEHDAFIALIAISSVNDPFFKKLSYYLYNPLPMSIYNYN